MDKAATRLKSLKTISKITRSMKAVAAAKHAQAQKEIYRNKICGKAALEFYEKIEVSLPQTIESRTLYVAVTSDRGLCGACNTHVCHFIKNDLHKEQSSNSSLMCIGVTGTNILKYYHPDLIVVTVDKLGKKLPSFLEASKIAQQLKQLEDDFNHVKIIYNEYISISKFKTQNLSMYSTAIVNMTPRLSGFGNIHLENIQSYVEFSLAIILFYVMRASYTSEQASRFRAMETATSNVDKIRKKISHAADRARQAAITSELLDIVATVMAQEKKN